MRVLVCSSQTESGYGHLFREVCSKAKIHPVVTPAISTFAELKERVASIPVDAVCITNPALLKDILKVRTYGKIEVSFSAWAGSRIQVAEHALGIPVMVLDPMMYLFAKPYGKFVLQTHLEKLHLTSPIHTPNYRQVSKGQVANALVDIKASLLCAVDIETIEHQYISVVGYACLLPNGTIKTWVVVFSSGVPEHWQMDFIKLANATPSPKVMHNGTYDSSYFARYRAPLNGYILDTEYLFYSIYSELPKTLAFVTAFYLPNSEYWKDTGGKDIVKYNALDCEYTLLTCLAILRDMPEYAKTNYANLFNTLPPALFMSMHGMKVNQSEMAAKQVVAEKHIEDTYKELTTLLGGIELNVNSPIQVKFLMYNILGAPAITVKGKINPTCAVALKRIAASSPLISRIIDKIVFVRKERKAVSTYFKAELLGGRLMYSYRIDGTETGRFSCKQHNFGKDGKSSYGTQIQNTPYYVKSALIADEGYMLADNDLSQAEARATAHLAGDTGLINALEADHDFYIYCATIFLGIPYDEVTLEIRNKVIKKIIHGTNYMMGAGTFMDTMGILALLEVRRQLDFEHYSPRQFAAYLLGLYHDAYPAIKVWYKELQSTIASTGMLVSPGGLTRRFFGDPLDHATLRSAVAHLPQSTSVRHINACLVRVFWELQVPSKGKFVMIAQIHDSLVTQARIGKEVCYSNRIAQIMQTPIKMPKGTTMVIPADGATGATWADCK